MITLEWLFREPNQNVIDIPRRTYNPKPLRDIAGENIQTNDKQLNKELAKKIINPYYFKHRALQIGFNMSLVNDHFLHAHSFLTIKPNFSGIETRYVD